MFSFKFAPNRRAFNQPQFPKPCLQGMRLFVVPPSKRLHQRIRCNGDLLGKWGMSWPAAILLCNPSRLLHTPRDLVLSAPTVTAGPQ
eukprot:2745372-Amphidinium_carterae.1